MMASGSERRLAASVVIPTRSNLTGLQDCLEALRRCRPATVELELIVVANAADAPTRAFLQRLDDVVVIESAVDLGFAGACNAGAGRSRADYLVLLNDDVIVSPGWLDALVEAVNSRPGIGAAVSRILFPDGRLQEAGSVITRSGWTANVGFGSAADCESFLTRRTVDYGSACSLLVRRASWEALGGFSEDYFPGYFEDVDFALSLRTYGEGIVYEPRSVVVHQRHGTPIDRAFRGFYYLVNKQRFVAKWNHAIANAIAETAEDSIQVHTAAWAAAGCPRRVLIIDDRWPDARFGSGHGRMAACAATLADAACAVSFWAGADEGQIDFAALGVQPVRGGLADHLMRAESVYTAVVISRPNNFRRYHSLVRRLQPQAAVIYDAEALYSVRTARKPGTAAGRRYAQSLEAARYAALEERIAAAADVVVTVSPAEAAFWQRWNARVRTIPPFTGAPLSPAPYARRDRVLFAAGWRAGVDSPNGDGLLWFVRDVLPLVAGRVAGFELDVLGDAPAELHLPEAARGSVRFLGAVADLGEVYDRTRVAIAPIRYGSGVKIKTLEALEHGVPVVGTAVAAEGVPVGRGVGLRVCDRAADFADELCELYLNPVAWARARGELEHAAAARAQNGGSAAWADALDAAVAVRAASFRASATSETG
jgi:GT2 family glycosyltransferase